MASECTFPSSAQEVLDLAFSDYNPFCANNRDPGATGKDICHGVKDLNNPLALWTSPPPPFSTPTTISTTTSTTITIATKARAASSSMKCSALQVLLYPFLLLMLFVKV